MNAFAIITLCLATAFSGGDGRTKGHPTKDTTAKIDVRIRTGAVARGLDVTIGELCEISPINRDTLVLVNIVFAPSPASGRARTVSRTEILQSLAASGQDVSMLTFSGPDEIVVQPVVVEVPSDNLVEAATAALQALLAIEGNDVEVEAPGRLRRVDAPPGRQRQDLVARVRGNKSGPSSAVVDVDIMVDGELCKRVPLTFKLQRFQMLLKTNGVIRAGSPIGPQNLDIVREPLAMSTGLYLTKFDDVAGMIAARNLQANSRVTLGDIAPPAVIHLGEVVTVVLTNGRIKVTAKAIANHDAPMGGRITLTNMQSRGSLTGVVAAPGLVVVH